MTLADTICHCLASRYLIYPLYSGSKEAEAGISRATNISRQSVYRIKRDALAKGALVE